MAFGKRRKKDKTMDETSQTSESTEEQEGVEAPAEPPSRRSSKPPARSATSSSRSGFAPGRLPEPPAAHAQEDIDAAVSRAKSEVLAEAITVLDYLDMALAAPVTTDEAKNLKVGVEMTRGQLQGLFDRLDVKPVVAEGTFDPALHQAVSTVETEEHEPGAIVEVVRGGWCMGETVLRYAQVRVAAAPEAEETAETEEEPSEDGE